MIDLKSAKLKFNTHKSNTRNRFDKNGNKIEFRLTFDEWIDIWLSSGFWDKRGRTRGSYVMSRKNDEGHYEKSNVFIQLCDSNHSEAEHKNCKITRAMLGRTGINHPKSKKIKTPLGIFNSLGEAASAHKIKPQSLQYRIKIKPDEYKKI